MSINLLIYQQSSFNQYYIGKYSLTMSKKNPQSQHQPLSKIEFTTDKEDSSTFISATHSSYYLESKTFCFYFPQLEVVLYQTLNKQQQSKETLEGFVRQLLRRHAEIRREGSNVEKGGLVFKTFDNKEDVITSESPLSFNQCARVKVYFQGYFPSAMITGDTRLVITPELDRSVAVDVNRHGNLRIFQLFIHYKLEDYRFGALAVGSQIFRHYQNLQKIKIAEGEHQAIPLFTFQTFYHDMHAIYNHLLNEKQAFQNLVSDYGQNPYENSILEQRYNLLSSSHIDRITLKTIIYLSSQFYSPQLDKKYLTLYNNGKIGNIFLDRQSQVMSTMLNHMEKHTPDSPKLIYIYERFQEQPIRLFKQGQVVRIQTFSPAVDKQRVQLSGRYFIFEIEHITAKNIMQYNCSKTKYTHLILPYNEYLVQSCKQEGRHYRVTLAELPTSKHLDSRLLLAINDNFDESRQLQAKILQALDEKMQIILLKDSKTYQVWLKKYFPVLMSRQYCVLYSKLSFYEGSQVIDVTRRLLGSKANLLLYGNFREEIHDSLGKREDVTITNSSKAALAFILECFEKNQSQTTQCHSCKCQVY